MGEQQPVILNRITRVLNIGYDLRRRLDLLAAPRGMDGSTLGRRIVEKAVVKMERAGEAGEPEHE